jgi:hypothetical protein
VTRVLDVFKVGRIKRLRGDKWTEAKAEGMKLQDRTMVFISPPCLALGTSEPACHPRVDWRFAAMTMRSSRILFSLHELSLRVSIMCLFATAVVTAESYPNVVLCMCILCIRSIFWSFGVAQTAAALVASGVALNFRVDNASYRMISKHSGGGIMATIYQEVPFCFSSTIHLGAFMIFCAGCVTCILLASLYSSCACSH